jgi:hypothetical protein
MNYFIATIRHNATAAGKSRKVSKQYLIDAYSFTEAEARVTEKVRAYLDSAFTIPNITKPKIAELFLNEEADKFYKVCVNFITLNEKTGIEKRTKQAMLVQADNFDDAVRAFRKNMQGTLADYEIVSVAETPILDYFKHEVPE